MATIPRNASGIDTSGGVLAARFGCFQLGNWAFTSVDPGTAYHARADWYAGKLQSVAYAPDLRIPPLSASGMGIVEKPVVYPQTTRNAPTIASLSFSAGILLGQFARRAYVEPRDWKGTMDGDVFLTRVRRHAERAGHWKTIERCLRDTPRPQWQHALDAYALGQWCLGVQI